MQREILRRIGPDRGRRPVRAPRERPEGVDRVFVAVLGMDGLAAPEVEALAAHADPLRDAAGEMHLDAPLLAVEERIVAELGEIEVSLELAVDAAEQVEIERRGDAFRV